MSTQIHTYGIPLGTEICKKNLYLSVIEKNLRNNDNFKMF